jgi:putative transposase
MEQNKPSRQPDDLPERKQLARGVFEQFNEPTIVFITVCTKDRVPWLANGDVHRALVALWKEVTAWLVGRYVVMPDHLHFFASPNDPDVSLEAWMKYWKALYSMNHKQEGRGWQRGHWDTRLRRHENYEEKWEYIAQNPVRRGLVKEWKDWPYQGEVHQLRWL